ncbi:MAG: cbb3-type cytochrome c oxidase subunit 3 [Gammaproteobacteria bacterium]|nr:cbb3-type cytochrome c oxidase subunit 3 [Gammaproteobacteria bacterium]
MDINTFRGITTTILLIIFIVFCFWAFSRKRKQAFSEAELLPFDDETKQQIKEKREVSTDE